MNEANKLRLLYFLVFCCTASWLPIFADFLKDRGLSGINIGIVLSITPAMMFLVQPLYGMVADRLGYKKCLLLASFLAAVTYGCYFIGDGFAFIFVLTVFMAMFYNTIQPLLDTLSLKLVERNPDFSYGTLRIAGAAGWAFAGSVVGYWISATNTTVIFAFSSISMLVMFFVAFLLAPDEMGQGERAEVQSFSNARAIFANKSLIFLLLCVFLVSVGGTTIWNFYSIYMHENGASAELVGYGISFQGLCELPLFYFSARIIGKFGMKTTLLITVFATAFRLFLYSVVKNPVAAIGIELLHGISWSLFWVVCVEYVDRLVRTDWRATGQSLLYAAYYGAGAIVGNLWTGYLMDTQMKISEVFLLNAGGVFVVGVLAWFFVEKENSQRAFGH